MLIFSNLCSVIDITKTESCCFTSGSLLINVHFLAILHILPKLVTGTKSLNNYCKQVNTPEAAGCWLALCTLWCKS